MRNSKVTDPNWPELEPVKDFMPVLVTSKFDEDLDKNECAILETRFFPLLVYGKLFRLSRAPNSERSDEGVDGVY